MGSQRVRHKCTHTRTRARRGWAPAWGRHLTRQAAAPSVGGVRAHVHVWALVLGDLSLPPELGTHEAWLEHIPHQPTGQIPQVGAWDQLLEAAALSMHAWPSASCRRAGSQRGKGEHTLSGICCRHTELRIVCDMWLWECRCIKAQFGLPSTQSGSDGQENKQFMLQ